MFAYVYTYIYTYIHTYNPVAQGGSGVRVVGYVYTYMHTYIHTYRTLWLKAARVYIYTYMHTYIHTYIQDPVAQGGSGVRILRLQRGLLPAKPNKMLTEVLCVYVRVCV